MSREELEDELRRVMRANDTEGLGRVLYPKYRQTLMNAPLQLTQRDINILCAEAEQTSDGFVEYKNDIGNAFNLLFMTQAFTAFDQQNQ